MKLSDITNLIFDRIMQNGWQGKIVSIEHQSDLETEIEAHQKSLLDEELYKACPTDAIRSDRFLVYAERCITFHNERPRDFPQWLDPSWHYSLVGYMICQNVCPINQKLLNWIEAAAAFSEKETENSESG